MEIGEIIHHMEGGNMEIVGAHLGQVYSEHRATCMLLSDTQIRQLRETLSEMEQAACVSYEQELMTGGGGEGDGQEENWLVWYYLYEYRRLHTAVIACDDVLAVRQVITGNLSRLLANPRQKTACLKKDPLPEIPFEEKGITLGSCAGCGRNVAFVIYGAQKHRYKSYPCVFCDNTSTSE